MKSKTKKLLCVVPIILAVILAVCVAGVTIGKKADESPDIPVMSGGVLEDTGSDTPPESEDLWVTEVIGPPVSAEDLPEPETETEPEPPDLSSHGLLYVACGDGTCLVAGMGSCTDTYVILPQKDTEGREVVGIADYAFRNCTALCGMELHDGIHSIGAYAFYGSGMKSINIPASVGMIGEYAFCGCYSLSDIHIDDGNPVYRDRAGVLYSGDGSVLLCYPAGRTDNLYTIGADVTEIRTMAFYNCNAIKLIHYAGGLSGFRKILVGAGNEVIESAVVTYSTSGDLFTDGREYEYPAEK